MKAIFTEKYRLTEMLVAFWAGAQAVDLFGENVSRVAVILMIIAVGYNLITNKSKKT